MQDSVTASKHCAKVLLDAWNRKDSELMSQLAARAEAMDAFYDATDPAESERLELVGSIALELHRSSTRSDEQDPAPYLRLLTQLASPDPFRTPVPHSC